MQVCTKCGIKKTLTDFAFSNQAQRLRHVSCRACVAQNTRRYYLNNLEAINQKRRAGREATKEKIVKRKRQYYQTMQQFVNQHKLGPCIDCGDIFHPQAMHFDHLPQYTKQANVSRLVSAVASKQRIVAEIAKCELVCACCHAVRTATRREKTEIKNQHRARHKKLIDSYKRQPCIDCRGCFPTEAMHLDHLPGTVKVIRVSALADKSVDRIFREIAKCELVCANCHAVRTAERRAAS